MSEQDFDKLLHKVMTAPQPSATLQDRLLKLADADEPVTAGTAANDGIWRRVLPMAACVAAALFLSWRYTPVQNPALEQEVLRHVYAEERFLESSNRVTLADVNSRMSDKIKAHLQSSPATAALDVRFAKDCWLAKQQVMHLIITGDTGPVSVMMIPSKVVDHETRVADDRFSGTITPLDHSTLIVLGNRQEPVRKYTALMAKSLEWEY